VIFPFFSGGGNFPGFRSDQRRTRKTKHHAFLPALRCTLARAVVLLTRDLCDFGSGLPACYVDVAFPRPQHSLCCHLVNGFGMLCVTRSIAAFATPRTHATPACDRRVSAGGCCGDVVEEGEIGSRQRGGQPKDDARGVRPMDAYCRCVAAPSAAASSCVPCCFGGRLVVRASGGGGRRGWFERPVFLRLPSHHFTFHSPPACPGIHTALPLPMYS